MKDGPLERAIRVRAEGLPNKHWKAVATALLALLLAAFLVTPVHRRRLVPSSIFAIFTRLLSTTELCPYRFLRSW